MPQLSLFLVQDLHASLPVAGLFFLTNLAAPVLGFWVGSWSDRLTDRLLLFRVGAVVGLVGWVLMAFTTHVWMAFAINLTVLGFAGATSSLIFAAVRDQLTHAPTGADNRVMSTVRLGFSLGFMTGPIVGSVIGGVAGLRVTLIVAGVCTLLQAAPMIGQRVERAVPDLDHSPTGAADGEAPAKPSLVPLLTFLGLSVLAMCGDTIKFAYLPIYMELQLGTPDWLRGVVISAQSVGMLIFIPIMGVLADRFGAHRLVIVNVLLGVVANIGFMIAGNEAVLIVATLFNAAMWATLGASASPSPRTCTPPASVWLRRSTSPRSGSPPRSAASPAAWGSAGSGFPACSRPRRAVRCRAVGLFIQAMINHLTRAPTLTQCLPLAVLRPRTWSGSPVASSRWARSEFYPEEQPVHRRARSMASGWTSTRSRWPSSADS